MTTTEQPTPYTPFSDKELASIEKYKGMGHIPGGLGKDDEGILRVLIMRLVATIADRDAKLSLAVESLKKIERHEPKDCSTVPCSTAFEDIAREILSKIAPSSTPTNQ